MKKSVYSRPSKPKTLFVHRRERVPETAPFHAPQVIQVDRGTECHVTPLVVAERMVSYLDPVIGAPVLEPQAGTGNLVEALLIAGYECQNILAIEQNYTLCKQIESRFSGAILPIQKCFLDYSATAGSRFPRIITNPPFRNVRQHMKAAINLLDRCAFDSAVLVGLMPVTYDHELAETVEMLPPDTFASTTVYTKIIRIEL